MLHKKEIIIIKIYSLLATIFWIVRQFAMPNPFEALREGLPIMLGDSSLILSPELLNWLADPIIFTITFFVVGLYYAKGSEPALGSILYMLFYAIHIGLLYLMLTIYPMLWLIVLIAVLYIFILVGIKVLVY